jgi:predicted pyridoxine 5'-phosphate oxidase superfamily flavin-nucleotide-binding protein
MANFFDIAFTPEVKQQQAQFGSRSSYARAQENRQSDRIGPDERDFLEARDGVFIATVASDGWPYVQFRGGPPGFLHVLDERTVAFADVRGNRQYISAGHLIHDDRLALIAMDFADPARLKLLGHTELLLPNEEPALAAAVEQPRADGIVERIVRIHVVALDWNCPQHIAPRWSMTELEALRESR